MAKPTEPIPVRYSEDLAQFADLRPVRRQPMTLRELVGLVLTTTGKDAARIQTRLQAGTCTYNIYRYWWEGFELEAGALARVLAEFPDPEPGRLFRPEDCLWVLFDDAQELLPHRVLVEKEEARRRCWFHRESFWDFLMDFAAHCQPRYHDYSYYHRADLYRTDALDPGARSQLLQKSRRLARRRVRERLESGHGWVRLELACGRGGPPGQQS